MEQEIKKTSKGAIAAIIIGFVLFIGAIIVGLVLLVIKFFPRDYIGTWNCDSGEILIVTDNNFNLFKNNGSYDNSDYSIKKVEIDNDKKNFIIETSSSKYDITIEKDSMFIIDKENSKSYTCTKKN